LNGLVKHFHYKLYIWMDMWLCIFRLVAMAVVEEY
jgi:hypothetical protein